MKKHRDLKEKLLSEERIRQLSEKVGPEFHVIALLIQRRFELGYSQEALAEKIGTKQSAISRFESGEYNPTLNFIYKIADVLNTTIEIRAQRKK